MERVKIFERYVGIFLVLELWQCKDTYRSFSSSHFSGDKIDSVLKLLDDRNKFACNKSLTRMF